MRPRARSHGLLPGHLIIQTIYCRLRSKRGRTARNGPATELEAGPLALAEKYLPTFVYVVFAGAVISAILSTVDSVLLSGGSIISHNVVAPLRPGLSEVGRVRAARACVVLLGLVAFAIALRSTTIHELVETASSIGSSGLIVVALFGLFTRFGGPAAALATGAVVWLVGIFFSHQRALRARLGLAALAYVVVGLLPARSPA